jgi:hypothetical protein
MTQRQRQRRTVAHCRSHNNECLPLCLPLCRCVCLHNDTVTDTVRVTHCRSHNDECLSLCHCVCLHNGTVIDTVRVTHCRSRNDGRKCLSLWRCGTVFVYTMTHCVVVTMTEEVLCHCATACIHTKTSDSHIHTGPHYKTQQSRTVPQSQCCGVPCSVTTVSLCAFTQ